MASKIRCNDNVIIISGKDKGKRGKIKKILSSSKAIVLGINIFKKHKKPESDINRPSGIIEKEMAIQISNIAIFNSNSDKADRIGFKIIDGKKIRIFKSSGKSLNNAE